MSPVTELSKGQRLRRGLYKRGPYRKWVTPEQRFWAKVDKEQDCWIWLGTKDRLGYGRFGSERQRMVLAHRFSYQLVRGAIPTGLVLDHLCRVPSCVNPDHLEAVTQAENLRRARWARGTSVGRP